MILSVVEVAQKFCDRILANRARWQALTQLQPQPQPLVCSSIHAGTSHPNHVGRKRSPVRCCSSLCVRIVLNYEMISYLRRKSRLVRIRETAGWLQVRTEEEGGRERGREGTPTSVHICLQSHAVWSWNVEICPSRLHVLRCGGHQTGEETHNRAFFNSWVYVLKEPCLIKTRNTWLGTSAELVPHKRLRNHVAFQSTMSRKICLRFKIGLNETTHVGLGLAMDRLLIAQRHLEWRTGRKRMKSYESRS